MSKIKKLVIVGLVILAMSAVSITALAADFGSDAVAGGKTYTLTEMLTYAVQDENLAYAEYAKIIETYGAVRPFSNIINVEKTHIAALEQLFTSNGVTIPENMVSQFVSIPSSLTEALSVGVQAEKNNIAMYESFLAQTLPDDVKTVFTALKSASEHHLAAFERSISSTTGGQYSNGKGMNGQKGSGCTGTGTGTGNMGAGKGRGQLGTNYQGSCVLAPQAA